MQELEKILEEIRKAFEENTEYIMGEDGEHRFVIDGCTATYLVNNIIREHMNDGWIPAKEKPAEDGFYVATMSGFLVDQEEPFVGLAEFEDGEWVDGDDVIARRPLPELYRPERRECHERK